MEAHMNDKSADRAAILTVVTLAMFLGWSFLLT